MTKAIHHPHDSIFKTCMGHLKVARSMVEQFIPKDRQQQLNLDSLQIFNTDFIDDGMSQTRADMLYRVNMMGDNEGRKAYVYLLWEHQSTYQKQMPLRMLGCVYNCFFVRKTRKFRTIPRSFEENSELFDDKDLGIGQIYLVLQPERAIVNTP